MQEHDSLVKKLSNLKGVVDLIPLPRNILNCFMAAEPSIASVDLHKIDRALMEILLPFQIDGVR